jgi:hypothetical protein
MTHRTTVVTDATTVIDRIDRIDPSLFDQIEGGLASSADRRSLLAVHAAVAARGAFRYLEVGSYLGASLQTFVADPRCTAIVAIDRRDALSPDSRPGGSAYPDNSTERMCELLAEVPDAEMDKLTALDTSTELLDPDRFAADLCLIDGEHTDAAALRDARFCRRAMRGRGVIVFHDRVIVAGAIRRFLAELEGARAYPLSHELFIVELGVPTLLRDARVRAQVPHSLWTAAARAGVTSQLLALGPVARQARRLVARAALTAGAPRRARHVAPTPTPVTKPTATFELNTFVNDKDRYAAMRASFAAAGFDPDAFVQLSDRHDDPYRALTRLGRRSDVRYPILCDQDLLADLGAGAAELESALRYLDRVAPDWSVAGIAGIMRSGRLVRRVVDVHGGFTLERLPLPAVTIDEAFVVLNPRNSPSCSPGAAGFHLYGADVCMRALAAGGSAYVIDFPLRHVARAPRSPAFENASGDTYQRARASFCETWDPRSVFRYVITLSDTVFLSRSRLLRRVFGAPGILTSVARRRAVIDRSDMRWIDRALAQPALRSIPKPLLDMDPNQGGIQPRKDPV